MPVDNSWPPGTIYANKTYNDTFAKACENRNQNSHNVKTQHVEKEFEVEQVAGIDVFVPKKQRTNIKSVPVVHISASDKRETSENSESLLSKPETQPRRINE